MLTARVARLRVSGAKSTCGAAQSTERRAGARAMSSGDFEHRKHWFLRELGITETDNHGVFNGRWGGKGKVRAAPIRLCIASDRGAAVGDLVQPCHRQAHRVVPHGHR
jgi:hypothetical protein